MKNIHPSFQSHLDSKTTTICYCWKITRRDGKILGFTEHDRTLFFDGVYFESRSGFNATAIQQSLGLNVDNLNVEGAISSAAISEVDIYTGKFDGAEIELYLVNWAAVGDPNMRYLVNRGYIGEIKREGKMFNAELRSLSQRLQEVTGRTYQRYCDAVLGDSRCKVDLTAHTYSTIVLDPLSSVSFVINSLPVLDDYFSLGKIRFTSGENKDLTVEIKKHRLDPDGKHTIFLWAATSFPLKKQTTLSITAGCRKERQSCVKFSNIVNFQGFEFIPGNDAVAKYPTRGAPNQNGESIFGN